MKIITVVFFLLIAVPCFAQTYIKVDDKTLRSIETLEKIVEMSIPEIKHELEGVRSDMNTITEQYNSQMAMFRKIEKKYTNMLDEATHLGLTEPIYTTISEPIEVNE